MVVPPGMVERTETGVTSLSGEKEGSLYLKLVAFPALVTQCAASATGHS